MRRTARTPLTDRRQRTPSRGGRATAAELSRRWGTRAASSFLREPDGAAGAYAACEQSGQLVSVAGHTVLEEQGDQVFAELELIAAPLASDLDEEQSYEPACSSDRHRHDHGDPLRQSSRPLLRQLRRASEESRNEIRR